jgi:nucleoside-diphosphate-sugar epimerase
MAAMKPSTPLSGVRVLVTGGTGFLGTHTVRRLAREGASVFATRRSETRSARLPTPGVTWLTADLVNLPQARAVVERARPEVVIHLAAYGASSVERDPQLLQDVNVTGTSILLAVVPPSLRFVMAGTCAEYGDVRGPASESMVCKPTSAYGAAKHAAVELVRTDARQTGRPAVVLRPYGPFGPGDDPHRVLPAVIAGLVEGREVAVTTGTQVRDFSYVEDHVRAIVLAATVADLEPGSIFNVGSGRGVTIRDALARAQEIVGGSGKVIFGARPMRGDDIQEMVPDVSAAKARLGFEVQTTFDEGVRRTAAFMRGELPDP